MLNFRGVLVVLETAVKILKPVPSLLSFHPRYMRQKKALAGTKKCMVNRAYTSSKGGSIRKEHVSLQKVSAGIFEGEILLRLEGNDSFCCFISFNWMAKIFLVTTLDCFNLYQKGLIFFVFN